MIPLIRVILVVVVVVVVAVEVMGQGAVVVVVEVKVVELILLLAVVAVATFVVRLVRLMVGTEDCSRRDELRLRGLLFERTKMQIIYLL